MEVVGEAADGREAAKLASTLKPDIAVLDVAMPLMNGIDTARELRKVTPSTKAVLLTQHDGDQYVAEALRAGVRGYVLKTQAITDLIDGILQVNGGEVYLSPTISRAVVDAFLSNTGFPTEPLSPRERQVLQLISEGRSTKEAARDLGISVKTAESHRARLMQKLDIHDVASLVRYAVRRGLVQA